jgi:transposase-like protein
LTRLTCPIPAADGGGNPKGTLMKKSSRKQGDTGKRYPEALRRKILAFVAKRGRGGISAATRTFGVSYIALRRWINLGPGGAPRGKVVKAGLDGRKARRNKTALATVKSVRAQLAKLQTALKQLSK